MCVRRLQGNNRLVEKYNGWSKDYRKLGVTLARSTCQPQLSSAYGITSPLQQDRPSGHTFLPRLGLHKFSKKTM